MNRSPLLFVSFTLVACGGALEDASGGEPAFAASVSAPVWFEGVTFPAYRSDGVTPDAVEWSVSGDGYDNSTVAMTPRRVRSPVMQHAVAILPDASAGRALMLASFGFNPARDHLCVQVVGIDQREVPVGCIPLVKLGTPEAILGVGGVRVHLLAYLPNADYRTYGYCYLENQPSMVTPDACNGSCTFDPTRDIHDYRCCGGDFCAGALQFDQGW